MSVEINGFTNTPTDPFVNISGTNYFVGLNSGTAGPYYFNIGNLFIFQEVGDLNSVSGTLTIPYDATIKYYLVGGGGAGYNNGGGGAGYNNGGGGGKLSQGTIIVNSGDVINITIGKGGDTNDYNGGDTSLSNLSNNIIALGGGAALSSGNIGGSFIDLLNNIYLNSNNQ